MGAELRGDNYRITNLTGRTLASGSVKPGINALDLHSLANGIYVLHVLQGNEVVHTAKISKQ